MASHPPAPGPIPAVLATVATAGLVFVACRSIVRDGLTWRRFGWLMLAVAALLVAGVALASHSLELAGMLRDWLVDLSG